MSVGAPIQCAECGVLHGNHQPSCGRLLWENFKRRLNKMIAELPVENRGRVRSRILWEAEAEVDERFGPKTAAEFMRAMEADGYNV